MSGKLGTDETWHNCTLNLVNLRNVFGAVTKLKKNICLSTTTKSFPLLQPHRGFCQ